MSSRPDGEPVSADRRDRRAAERRALRNVLFAVGLFAGVVLVNGLVFLLLLEVAKILAPSG
jgi:hypothetical protein